MRAIDQSIAKGLAYLSSAQTSEGTFITQFSSDCDKFVAKEEVVTTFAPVLILQTLAKIDEANEIRQGLVKWLLQQQSNTGAFNYWPIGSTLRQTRPYPDDLDDTTCALAGIYLHDPKLVDSEQLAKLVRLLITSESTVGGPYNTWLVNTTSLPAWRDVDLAVNCNIAFLLQLVAEPLPKLHAFIDRAVAQEDFRSRYYSNPLVVMYFIARACQSNETKQHLINVLRQRDNLMESPGKTALKLTALRNLGDTSRLDSLAESLLQSQQSDGSWHAESIWLDRAQQAGRSYAGSPALTTAFAIEALSRASPVTPSRHTVLPADSRLQIVFRAAQSRLSQLPAPLVLSASHMLESLRTGDNASEIALLPYLFVDSLVGRLKVPEIVLKHLSIASIFGWMAYGAYDDFLDGGSEAQQLPVANVAMRLSLESFAIAVPDLQFTQFTRRIFDRIDAANAWEMTHCRFANDDLTITIGALPKYPSATFLSERSVGHALTPLAILKTLGKSTDDVAAQHFLRGFRHYLSARQLNDDLHDWQEDFQAGRVSYVVVRLLRESGITGRHSKAVILPKLERQFWHDTLTKLCNETALQLQKSRQGIASSGLLKHENVFLQLVSRLEEATNRTIDEQKRAQDFLNYYTNKNSR